LHQRPIQREQTRFCGPLRPRVSSKVLHYTEGSNEYHSAASVHYNIKASDQSCEPFLHITHEQGTLFRLDLSCMHFRHFGQVQFKISRLTDVSGDICRHLVYACSIFLRSVCSSHYMSSDQLLTSRAATFKCVSVDWCLKLLLLLTRCTNNCKVPLLAICAVATADYFAVCYAQ